MFAGKGFVEGNPIEGEEGQKSLNFVRVGQAIDELQMRLSALSQEEKQTMFEKYPGLDQIIYARTQEEKKK